MTTTTAAYLADMIAQGNYSFVNRCLKDGELHLPDSLTLGLSPRIFGFIDHDIFTADAEIEMMKSGYEPATFVDILSYGALNKADEYSNLVALGSTLNLCGGDYSPSIARRGKGRELHLFPKAGRWFAPVHFLGVIRCSI